MFDVLNYVLFLKDYSCVKVISNVPMPWLAP
jgi:hypothetical protein